MTDRSALEIEVTNEMIEAGVNAACLFNPIQDEFCVMLPAIYRAMVLASQHADLKPC